MHSKLLVLGALPILAFARAYPPLLRGRTAGGHTDGGYTDGGYVETPVKTCEDIEQQTCGDGCVPVDYTCCPTQEGACAPGFECQLGDNDEYGCCPEGEECVGDGGAITTSFSAPLPTSTAPAYEEEPTPTDDVEQPTSTDEVEEPTPTDKVEEPSPTDEIEEPPITTEPTTTGPVEETEPTSTEPAQEPEPTVISTPVDSDLPTTTATDSFELTLTTTQEPDTTATSEPTATGTVSEPEITGTPIDISTTTYSFSSSNTLIAPPVSYTISTIYTTTTRTITSCPPTITVPCNAGEGGSVVIITQTIAVSTTICPVTTTTTPTNTHKQPILPPVKPTYGCSQGIGNHCPRPTTSPVNTKTTSPHQPWGTAPAGYTGIFTGQLPTTASVSTSATTTSRVPVTAGAAGKGVQGASWVGGVVAGFAVLGWVF